MELIAQAEQHLPAIDAAAAADAPPEAPQLGRRGVWFHHIISKVKRADLKSVAADFAVGGYFKIGWPGVMICEGEESDVDEFLRAVHRWRWQAMVVRATEVSDVEDVASSRVLPAQLVELPQDAMSDLAARCEEAGLQHLFRAVLNLEPK